MEKRKFQIGNEDLQSWWGFTAKVKDDNELVQDVAAFQAKTPMGSTEFFV